jgi:uncharacterized protein YcbK (DUF882 family)
MDPPFVPKVENEIDTIFFNDQKKFDLKELQEIQEDMDNYNNNSYERFDSTIYNTLLDINKKKAKEAILKANSLTKYKSEAEDKHREDLEVQNNRGYYFDSLI